MTIGPRRPPTFLFGTELECMTVTNGELESESRADALRRFLGEVGHLAPSLPGPSGLFNAYGRVYVDCGEHVELALAECDSPYQLASVVERQQRLVARALGNLRAEGLHLRLANNNHSGRLTARSDTWGSHENYLVERHPTFLGERILPFLVTRLYGGAGGVHFPSARYLAAVRPVFLRCDVGGHTTRNRAIHSTSREEHLMGAGARRFRYHLILGDGHRSQFSLALQFGATALALKAVLFDRELRRRLPELSARLLRGTWVRTLKALNVLALAGRPPKAAPIVIEAQRVYLDGARRYAARLADPPAWIERTLADWTATLDALERRDHGWLAARLDPFIKYELFTTFLAEAGRTWRDVRTDAGLASSLALLDHSYHEFGDPDSAFDRLDRAGVLEHRVCERIEPGLEAEPFVVETTTRARARGRFLKEHAGRPGIVLGWSRAHDRTRRATCELDDPFATEFGPWQVREDPPDPRSVRELLRGG